MMAPQLCFVPEIKTKRIDSKRSRSEVIVDHNSSPKTVGCREEIRENPGFLWLGGGGAYLINKRYVVLVLRDEAAPSNPNKLTVATGLSDGPDEWTNPNLLMRELFEEVLIIKNKNTIMVPCVPGFEDLAKDSISFVKNPQTKMALKTIPAKMFIRYQDELIVNGKKFEGIFCVHQKTRTVNFMKIIEVEIQDLGSISFLDTERDKNGNLLERDVFLFDLIERKLLDQNYIEVTKEYSYTHHSQYLISKLSESKND